MEKKWICLFIVLMMVFSVLPLSAWGQGYIRHITGDFYGLGLRVDHLPIPLQHPGFFFDDHIYLSLQDTLSAFGLEGGYDEEAHVLRLHSDDMLQTNGGATLAAELLQKDFEIASVERQIEALEKELQEAEEAAGEDRLPRRSISTLGEMRGYLRDHFEYLGDIPVSIAFRRISNSRYEVGITFSTRYHDDFQNLSRRSIEYYLDDIFYAITELYDEDARVEGSIRDNRSRNYITYVEFDTWRNALRFDFKRSVHRNSGIISPALVAASNIAGQHASRILTVGFQSIGVEIHGRKLNWFREPFFYDGEIYLSFDDLAEVLHYYYTFNREDHVLEVFTNNNISGVLKDISLAQLLPRLERLRQEVAFVRGAPYPYRNITSVSGMQSYLRVYFGELEDIPMTIDLEERRDHSYRLNIRFANRYAWDFEDIERRIIEGWLDAIFYAIRGLYDADAVIFGDIRDNRSSRNAITFLEFDTRNDSLVFDFQRSSHRDDIRRISGYQLEEYLNREARRYDGISFSYDVMVNRSDIDLLVSFNSRRFEDWSTFRKMDYLRYLLREINYDINVNGRMVDTRDDQEVLRFSFEDKGVRSFDLLKETEDMLNMDYGVYRGRWEDLGFTYFLREKSPDVFEVKVEGDFSREDADWRYVEENYMVDFEAFIRDALSHVQYIWDVTVFGEVVDHNMSLITSISLFDDDVRPVYASPWSGSITSGTLVELWTNTPDASIFYTIGVNNVPNNPTTSSARYSNRIAIDGAEGDTVTIKAFALKDGMTASEISTFTYDIMDVSRDLDSIVISNSPQGFSFKPGIYSYPDVRVAEDVTSITITATGKGKITIDGTEVSSGTASTAIALSPGLRRKIEITHEENGRERRVYTIDILRQVKDSPVIQLASDYIFGTGIVGVFNGRLMAEGNPNFDFKGYQLVLLSRSPSFEIGGTNNPYTLSSNGDFSITGFDISTIAKLIGYRYELYDADGQQVSGGDL